MKRHLTASVTFSLLTLFTITFMPANVGTVIGGGFKVAPSPSNHSSFANN